MDTNLLRAFIVVARTLSFTRAAEQLGTTQPLLSRAMRRLEDIVGEPLFDRRKRQIALTPSGAALLEEAPAILDREGLALRRAQMAGQGAPRALRIGYGGTMWMHMVYRGVRKFRTLHPDVALDFRLMKTDDQVDALRRGEIDVGLIDINACDRRGLSWRIIGREPYILALPSDWSIANGEPVDLAAFRDRAFLIPDPAIAPEAHSATMACCAAAGFQPNIVKYTRDASEMRFLVAAGLGAGFAYGSSLQTEFDGVRFAPMARLPAESYVEIHLIWADRNLPSALREFLDCMISETHVTEILTHADGFRVHWRHVVNEGLAKEAADR